MTGCEYMSGVSLNESYTRMHRQTQYSEIMLADCYIMGYRLKYIWLYMNDCNSYMLDFLFLTLLQTFPTV